MDYSALIAELTNSNKRGGQYTDRKIRELLVYLKTLQESGNYLMAEQAIKNLGE